MGWISSKIVVSTNPIDEGPRFTLPWHKLNKNQRLIAKSK
jgi:hypothetical protein